VIGLSRPRRLVLWALNLVSIAFLILPLVPVVLGSLQSEKSMQKDVRALLPSEVTLANFKLILSGGRSKGPIFEQVTYLPKSVEQFPTAFGNSLIVALAVTFTTLAAASLSAYTVARLRTPWTQALLQLSLVSRMVPLVVPYFAVFPAELEDAARIDGCTRWQALLRIILPLSTPGLAAGGVILFILSWHELLIPLIVASRPEVMTVPVILAGLVSDYFVFFTLMMAICLLGLLPTLVLVLALQRYVVRGLVAGALKG